MNREELGKMVREIWVNYAKEIADKNPTHYIPWGDLDEPNKEIDRRIGEQLYILGFDAGLKSFLEKPIEEKVDPLFYVDVGFNK